MGGVAQVAKKHLKDVRPPLLKGARTLKARDKRRDTRGVTALISYVPA